MLTAYIIVRLLIKIMQDVTICESFQIMLSREGTVVDFCRKILKLGRWKLQLSRCKCPGVPRGQPLEWMLISAFFFLGAL